MDEETRITKFAQAFAKAQFHLAMAEASPLIWQHVLSKARGELEVARMLIPESVRERIAKAAQICADIAAKASTTDEPKLSVVRFEH